MKTIKSTSKIKKISKSSLKAITGGGDPYTVVFIPSGAGVEFD